MPKLLDKLPDDAIDGMVGQTRKLAAQSAAVTYGFLETKSPKGHFLVRYAPGPDATIAELAGEVLDAQWEVVGDDLGLKPADPIRVELLGAPADLAKLSPLTEADIETTGTIALSKYNKLMVVSPRATIFGYPWMDTLAHEYTHLVVSRISHDTVPIWLQEGLARFQADALAPSARGRVIGDRARAASRAALRKEPADHARRDASVDGEVAEPRGGGARIRRGLHAGRLDFNRRSATRGCAMRMLVAQRDGKSARRAVSDGLKLSWPAVEREWHNHLRVDPKAVVGRTGKPIRFSKGGTDSENVGLEQVGVRARKHARLGAMLRARGNLAAAAIEYEKALGTGTPEPFVAGKLARKALVELGRFDKAIELATPLAAADEHDATAAVTLGIAHTPRARNGRRRSRRSSKRCA